MACMLISLSFLTTNVKQLTLERASRSSKPVKYLEHKIPSLDMTRLCVSFAEAKFGRLFFKPITVPGRIWLSWKGTKIWRQLGSSSALLRTTDNGVGTKQAAIACPSDSGIHSVLIKSRDGTETSSMA